MPRVPPVTRTVLTNFPPFQLMKLNTNYKNLDANREIDLRPHTAIASTAGLQLVQPRSIHMAIPIPPPIHRVARPFLASRRIISNISVVNTLVPEAPTG